MKTGTSRHPKIADLCIKTGLQKWQAVGLLECIWEFACEFSPQGDIGKWTDEQIAEAIGFREDPRKIVANLVESGWLDTDSKHRLVIHGWEEHCPRFIKQRLIYKGLTFIRADSRPFAQSGADSEHKPKQFQPNPTKGQTENNDEVKTQRRTSKTFIQPTIEELKEYIKEINANIDPESFIAFYESNGWKVGKNPMKSWKAAVRTWDINNKKNNIEYYNPSDEAIESAKKVPADNRINFAAALADTNQSIGEPDGDR